MRNIHPVYGSEHRERTLSVPARRTGSPRGRYTAVAPQCTEPGNRDRRVCHTSVTLWEHRGCPGSEHQKGNCGGIRGGTIMYLRWNHQEMQYGKHMDNFKCIACLLAGETGEENRSGITRNVPKKVIAVSRMGTPHGHSKYTQGEIHAVNCRNTRGVHENS